MSLGLLDGYGSDDSNTSLSPPSLEQDNKECDPPADNSSAAPSKNFFDDQFEADSSSDESDSEDGGSLPADDEPAAVPEVLPLPDLVSLTQPTAASVFSNPYKMAEEAKLAVLTRHVNLTPAELPEKQRQKKPRFSRRRKQHSSDDLSEQQGLFDDKDSSLRPQQPKKVRSGIAPGLVPGKKYMKTYRKIQETERPWTLSQK